MFWKVLRLTLTNPWALYPISSFSWVQWRWFSFHLEVLVQSTPASQPLAGTFQQIFNCSFNLRLSIYYTVRASCIGLVIYLKKKNALHFVARDWHSENYNLTWPRVTWMRDFTWPSQTEDQLCAQSDIKARIVVNPSSIYFLCFRKFKSNAWRGKWSNVWASFFRINFSFLSSSC